MAPKMARPGHVEIAMTDASFLKRNGLSIAVILMMLTSWLGQALTGHAAHNDELQTMSCTGTDNRA